MLPTNLSIKEESYVNTYTNATFIDPVFGEFESTFQRIKRGECHPQKKMTNLEVLMSNLINIPKFNKKPTGITDYFPYLPDFKLNDNLYVNIDGLFYHSITYKKDPKHHIKIREEFEKHNKRVMIFREDELLKKPHIIKSIIDNATGNSEKFYARHLQIKQVIPSQARDFLNENHMQGYISSAYVGLYKNDVLLMIVGANWCDTDSIELSRVCTKIGSVVIGGLGKLLNELLTHFKGCKQIRSWVDKRFMTGNGLKAVGFEPQKTILGFRWTDNYRTYYRMHCRAKNGKSESQVAEEMGLTRIYDAGQELFIKNLK
jgi:hypothetical protein